MKEFPNENIKQILDKYEILQDHILDLKKQLDDQDEQKNSLIAG